MLLTKIKLIAVMASVLIVMRMNGQTCDTITADYNQGFELFTPGAMGGTTIDCWSNKNAVNPVWTAEDGTTTTSLTGPSGPHEGARYLFLETSSPASAGQADTLTSPVVDVSSISGSQLSFYYHMYGASMGTLRYEASGDGGGSWDSLGVLVGQQHVAQSSAWSQKIVQLAYEDSVQVRFIGIRGINFYSDMAIDDIWIETSSLCTAPLTLSIIERADTSAILSWVAGGSEMDWIISYGPQGSAAGAGTLVPIQDTFAHLNGLDGEYDAYVRSVCTSGDTSAWFGPISWVTAPTNFQCQNAKLLACDSVVLDSTYDAVEQANLPLCGTDPGTYGLWYAYMGDGHQVTLSTDNTQTNFDTKINVYKGDCKTLICVAGDDDGGSNSTSVLSFPTKVGVLYSIYVSGFSTNQGVFQLEVTCEECFSPTEPIVSDVSTDSVNVSWTSPIGSTGFVLEYGEAGFAFGSGTQVNTGTAGGPLSLLSLNESTVYEFYLWEYCDGMSTDTIGPIEFATVCRETVPYYRSFESYKPYCWDEADFGNPNTGPVALGGSSWGNDFWLNDVSHPNGNCARINVFFIHSDWLISPVFNLPDTNYALHFDIGSTEYNDSIASIWPSSDSLKLLYSEDEGLSWTEIHAWDSLSTPSHLGDSFSIPLASSSGLVQFAFWATSSGINSPGDIEIFVDNFEIKLKANALAKASCRDTTLYLNANGLLEIVPELLDDGNSVGSLSLSQDSFDLQHVGVNSITLYAATNLGTDSCSSMLTIVDTFIVPSANCQDITIYLDDCGMATISPSQIDDGSVGNLTIDQSMFKCDDLGVGSVTLYATTNAGTDSCMAATTVLDTFKPTLMCRDTFLILDSNDMAVIDATSWLDDANDNCQITSISLSQDTFNQSDVGNVSDTVLVFDASGNSAFCVFEVSVLASIEPCIPLLTFSGLQEEGIFHADTIESSSFVDNPDIAKYKVATLCTLFNGFEVELGAEFEVTIEDCD